MPEPTAVYDLADIRSTPGTELLLLGPDGILILSLAGPEAPRTKISVGPGTTVGVATDERGLERFHLVFGDERLFIGVPTFRDFVVLSPEGKELARLDIEGRANFFIPQNSGLAFLESDAQLFFDAPHISLSDMDHDGHDDIIASNRHEIRVFRGQKDGGFSGTADLVTPLDIISQKDQIRGSGGVAVDIADIDGDGDGDLVATYLSGNFSDATMETRVYKNSGTGWNLAKPDRVMRSENAVGLDRLVDLDGDGQLELVRGTLSFSLLEFVEALLTREVDTEFVVYRIDETGNYADAPSIERELEIPLSFETFRPEGFLPVFGVDMNRDAHGDLVLSGGGERIEILFGGPGKNFERVNVEHAMDTQGLLRLGDWNSDGLTDLLIFDPQDPEQTVRIAINRGVVTPKKSQTPKTGPKARRP